VDTFFPAKDHWKYPSQLCWIREGLEYISEYYERWGLFSPALNRGSKPKDFSIKRNKAAEETE
jgi:hypothetical protein